MCFFCGKRKVYVDTTAVRVVDEEKVPETLKVAVLEALFTEEQGEISTAVRNSVFTSTAVRFEQLYSYGKHHYHYGLPNSQLISRTSGRDIVAEIIGAEVGYPVTLTYFGFKDFDNTHAGWKHITEHYGYNHETNELTTLSTQVGHPVHLYNIVALYPQAVVDAAAPGSLEPLGPAPAGGYTERERPLNGGVYPTAHDKYIPKTRWEVGTEEGFRVEYVWWDSKNKQAGSGNFTVSTASYDHDGQYFQAGYYYDDANLKRHFGHWTYQYGSGTQPKLDALYTRDTAAGTFFPVVVFRDQKDDKTADVYKDTAAFKTAKQLVKYLSMDFQEIGTKINENPDIDKIEQATLMMGVEITSQAPEDIEYLFRFFERAYKQQPYEEHWIRNHPDANETALVIEDANFHATLTYAGISLRNRAGKVGDGKIGNYSNTTDSFIYKAVRYGYDPMTGTTDSYTEEVTYYQRVFRKQISTGLYQEIRITNPVMRYKVDSERDVLAKYNEDRLLVPVDRALTQPMNFYARERLYFRSLHFVFNSRVVQKVDWYETGIFKDILTVIAVVIIIYTLITTGIQLAKKFADGFIAVLKALALTTLKAVAINFGFQLVVEELGLENSFIIAVIATVALAYVGYANGGLEGAPWAEELLFTASNLNASVSAEAGELIAGYHSEMQEFKLMAEEAYKELEEVRKELNTDYLLDPAIFTRREPFWIPNETPDAFFQRTVESGNIGIVALDAPDTFVENSLKLPDIYDTLGDTFYSH